MEPPPCDELTTSEPRRNATRVNPPGKIQVLDPVTAKGRRSTCRGSTCAVDQGRRDRQLDAGLADVIRRVGEQFRAAFVELLRLAFGPTVMP